MTKAAALQSFFAQFGIAAYAASSVPDDAVFPWLTYELITGSFDGGAVSLTVNLWYYTDSEAVPNAKAQEIADTIGYGGALVPCDGGYIWIRRGSPWCQSVTEASDKSIKRRYINVTAEFLTKT